MPAIQVMLSMEDGRLSVHSAADAEMTFAIITSAWVSALEQRILASVGGTPAPEPPRIVSANGPLPGSLGTRPRRRP